mmetsp:Transcript_51597/g.170981  ORF Transcript_51597/g.170981 Transcript_51597/m.170981 type:complete len:333 (-) Transcript_51597:324-1322(-)
MARVLLVPPSVQSVENPLPLSSLRSGDALRLRRDAQLLRLVVQRVDDAPHVVERLERLRVGSVCSRVLVHDQAAGARVEDAAEFLVEDHLRELLLDLEERQAHQRRDVGRLDRRVRLDDPADVLLQQHVVQRREVALDDLVAVELRGVRREGALKVVQRPLLVRLRHRAHRLEPRPRVLCPRLARDRCSNLLWAVHHDLAEQHVLEDRLCARVADRLEVFKRLVKVGEGRLVLLLLGVQRPRHRIDLRLQHRRAVDRVGRRPRRRQRRLALWQVEDSKVDLALHQVDLDEQRLVVEALDLALQLGEQGERLRVLLRLEQQRRQPRLDPLPQE